MAAIEITYSKAAPHEVYDPRKILCDELREVHKDDPTPKHRIEHAKTGTSHCTSNSKSCKKGNIESGELRFGTWGIFFPPSAAVPKFIWSWKHWRCVTPAQIRAWAELAPEGDLANLPGYVNVNAEAQKAIREAIEAGRVAETDFQGWRNNNGPDVHDPLYAIQLSPNNRAGCQATTCKPDAIKIKKGQLRLSYSDHFGESSIRRYKHWTCLTPTDIQQITAYAGGDILKLEGMDELSDTARGVVTGANSAADLAEEFEMLSQVTPKKRGRKTKVKVVDQQEEEGEVLVTPKKRGRKPKAKFVDEDEDGDYEETTPITPKKRGRKSTKPKAKLASLDEGETEDELVSPMKRTRKNISDGEGEEGGDGDEGRIAGLVAKMRDGQLETPRKR